MTRLISNLLGPVRSKPEDAKDHGAGYDSGVARDIQQIRQNLDGYKGLAWLKEMVQNADDAGAHRLELGWVVALPDVAFANPLLGRTPAVFVLNDGPFEQKHACALHKLGSSDKNADGEAIGRFGLGMKSLFHWCEAFFYLSSGHDTFTKGSPYPPDRVFSPWFHKDQPLHEEWAGFAPDDRKRLVDYLRRLGLIDGARWFCLWIPLRTKDSLSKSGLEPIVPEFPGDEASPDPVFGPDPAAELAPILPMMQSLWRVRLRGDNGRGTGASTRLDIQWDDKQERSRRPRDDMELEATPPVSFVETWAGGIEVRKEKGDPRPALRYAGAERLSDDAVLADLRRKEGWPHTQGTDPKFFGRISKPVRRARHGAAYFVRSPSAAGRGRLRVRWAAFLPLRDEPDVEIGGESDYTLILHGDFFPNVSRTDIDFPRVHDPLPPTVPQRWNKRLRDTVTLPLILTAIERLANEIDAADIGRITRGLRDSSLFAEHRNSICDGRQWIPSLGSRIPGWRLASAADTAHPLPGSALPSLHREVFPGLASALGAGRHAVPVNATMLHPEAEAPAPWPPDRVATLLASVPAADTFGDPARLDYLVAFLDLVPDTIRHPAVARALKALAHEAFAKVGVRRLSGLGLGFARFLGFLPDEARVGIDVDGLDEEVVEELLRDITGGGSPPGVVLVPARGAFAAWDRLAPRPGRLPPDDGCAILPALARVLAAPEAEAHRSALATGLVAAMGASASSLGGSCSDLPLFAGGRASEPRLRPLSLRELDDAFRRGRLFVDDARLAAMLEAALGDGIVLIDESGVSRHLYGGRVGPCDARACLGVLDAHPRLAEDERPRLDLLRELIKALPDEDIGRFRAPLRYLLHGLRDRFDSDEDLFAGVTPGLSRVWEVLARRALALRGEGWRILEGGMPNLRPADVSRLRVRSLDRAAVADLVREAGPGRVDVGDLTDADRESLVHECEPGQYDIVRDLSIHRTVAGGLVALDERCYWKGDNAGLDDLPEGIILLEPAANAVVRAQQKQIHPQVLDARGRLGLVLGSSDPSFRWRAIVEALQAHAAELPPELKGLLRKTPWLPVEGDRPASPEEVVWINASHRQDLLLEVLTDVRPGPRAPRGVPLLALPDELRDPARFKAISERFEARFEVREGDLKRLGEILGSDPRHLIGPFEAAGFDIESFLHTFAGAPKDVMRCARLVGHLCEEKKGSGTGREGQVNQFRKHMLPALLGPIAADRLVAILDFLADRITDDPGGRREARDWHDRYLRAAAGEPTFRSDILPRIRLLDRAGRWKPAGDLGTEPEGIVDGHLLDQKQAGILKPVLPLPEETRRPLADEVQASRDLLGQARAWESSGVEPAVIGVLLTLLGDHERVLEVAGRFLDRPRAAILARFGWTDPEARRYPYEIVFNDSKTVQAFDLFGDPVSRPLREDFNDLWLGSEWGDDSRIQRIELRAIPDGPPPRERMAAVLKATARFLITQVYFQPGEILDEVWDDLEKGDQLDVPVAQSIILRNTFGLLGNLAARRDGPLGAIRRLWREASEDRAEADRTGNRPGAKKLMEAAEKKERQAIDKLRDLLEADPPGEAIGELLDAVRLKIGQFEYKPDSVPFELFQNADDAAVELARHTPASAKEHTGRFVLKADAEDLRVAHAGRPINCWRLGDYQDRDSGYRDDLVKMLQLNWSDKAHDEAVTGRFGLGFKSVFLVSDSPRALSGRLAFEIVGGLYPRGLDRDARAGLEEGLKGLWRDFRPGKDTLLVIPWREGTDADEVVGRFCRMAHVLVVFARRLRECVVWPPGGPARKAEWTDHELEGVPGAYFDRLRPVIDDAGREQPALVLRAGGDDPGALLLGLGEGGFAPLAGIPAIWATAPAGSESGLGLALNADFDLDAGRAQPAKDMARNRGRAGALGRRLGERLVRLFDAAGADWTGLRTALGIAPDRSPEDLWRSLWDVAGRRLAKSDAAGPEGVLLRIVLWGDADRGMARLVAERDALPTDLPGAYGGPARCGRITHATGGLMAESKVFEAVASWPQFAARHRPGTIVGREISQALKELTGQGFREVRLEQVVEGEVAQPDGALAAASETARRLGALISVKFIQPAREGTAEEDRKALEGLLQKVQFRNRNDSWQLARDLLIDDPHAKAADESARAAFAPPTSVLHPDYDAAGRDFARACRPAQRMNADVEQMATWGWEAPGERRRAFIDYLAGILAPGELLVRLREDIAKGRLGWIAQLELTSPEIEHRDWEKRWRLRVNLGLERPAFPQPTPKPLPLEPGRALEKLHELAVRRRAEVVDWYERRVYPEGVRPTWKPEGPWDCVDTRRDWLILFLLGATHTMGRYHRGQHKGFLEECNSRGWLRIFAEEPRDPAQWMGILDEYLDEKVHDMEYHHWLRQFISIYQLSRWLEPNARNFIRLGEARWEFELAPRLAPREDALFEPEITPPLLPVLGHGANFILRELARTDCFDRRNACVHRHLYPAYAGVRRLLSDLGCPDLDDELPRGRAERVAQSTLIHRFLVRYLGPERAHFEYTFDLPLLWVIDVPEIWAEVMGDARRPAEIEDGQDDRDLEDGP